MHPILSLSTAAIGSSLTLPQISFKSSAKELSDKDLYPYFARTCASDAAQGPALSNVLIHLGITPYVVVVSTTDGYATSMSEAFSSSYESAGNIILDSIVYTPSSSTDYDAIITRISQTGTPAVVLVLYPEEVEKVLAASKTHPVMSSDSVLWIGADSWIDLELNITLPPGIVGVSSYQADNIQKKKYTELWSSLDPSEYPDTDDDRTILSPYSLYIMDAVTALALAYQKAIDDATGLQGTQLKQYVYNALTKDIYFTGVSGEINFDSQGDLTNPQFRVINYLEDTGWKTIGLVTSTSVQMVQEVVWPDGTVSNSYSGYSEQLVPYCPPGEEPVLGSNGIYICSQCNVGYYSAYWGAEKCKVCPVGTDCNDVGIVVPCILKDYWRSIPPSVEEEGDFQTYRVYSCDQLGVCKGGCQLNATCIGNRDDYSPTCGVCLDGYYLNDGKCYQCAAFDDGFVVVLLCMVVFLVFILGLTTIMWCSVQSIFEDSFPAPPLSVASSQTDVSKEPTPLPPSSKSRISAIFNVSRLAGFLQRADPSARHKVFRGTSMTFKLLLSFIQVVSGSFYLINMEWSHNTQELFQFTNLNPMQALDATYQCSMSQYSSDYRFFIVLLFQFCIPLIFLLLLLGVGYLVYFALLSRLRFNLEERDRDPSHSSNRAESISSRNSELQVKDRALGEEIWSISTKMYLWFCLIAYPTLSSGFVRSSISHLFNSPSPLFSPIGCCRCSTVVILV